MTAELSEQVKRHARIEQVVGRYVKLQADGAGELKGLCPFHKEKTPSFSVTPSKGLFFCFGCQATGDVFDFVAKHDGLSFPKAVEQVADIVGFHPTAQTSQPAARTAPAVGKVVATYAYTDHAGELVYEKLRIEPGRDGRKKDFRYRRKHPIDGAWVYGLKAGTYGKTNSGDWVEVSKIRGECHLTDELPDCERPLYRLPDVLAADAVLITEGEKDADNAVKAGYVATTTGGANGKWLPEYDAALAGKRVFVIPDQDAPGRKRGAVIAAAIRPHVSECVVVDLPDGKDISDYLERHTVAEFSDLLDAARRKQVLDAIEAKGLLHPREILEITEGGVDALLDPSSRRKGVMTGFKRLDQMTMGLHQGEVFILAARPSMGKTALALNIVSHACQAGHSVAVFSLEMSRESILTRMICSRASADQAQFRGGWLGMDERRRLAGALTEICEWRLYIDDQPGVDLKSVRTKLDVMRREAGLDLVVIDYLQLMRSSGRENRSQEVGQLSRGLKQMARELKVPFLVLSQLSRATESRPGDHRPQLSDLRDSGEVEQDADLVGFIYREEVYKPDREDLRGYAELIVRKQRNGPVGTVKLNWLNRFTRFENPSDEA